VSREKFTLKNVENDRPGDSIRCGFYYHHFGALSGG
jgi:hypothetical protein